ncbi:unnamed protein product [Sphagnum balticum]
MKRKMDERLTLDDEQISRIKSNLHYNGCFISRNYGMSSDIPTVTERRPCWNADPSGNPCKETLRAALSLVDLYSPPFASELCYRWSFALPRRLQHTRIGQHGKRRYDRKQSGYGGQTKPVFHKKAKTTKKIVLRLQCQTCKHVTQHPIKRCKHFEIGGDKKGKGTSLF